MGYSLSSVKYVTKSLTRAQICTDTREPVIVMWCNKCNFMNFNCTLNNSSLLMANIHLYYRQIEHAMSVERNLLQSTIFMFIWELILGQNHSSVSSVVKLFLRVQACTDMWELHMNSFYKNLGLSLNKGNILTLSPTLLNVFLHVLTGEGIFGKTFFQK